MFCLLANATWRNSVGLAQCQIFDRRAGEEEGVCVERACFACYSIYLEKLIVQFPLHRSQRHVHFHNNPVGVSIQAKP